MPDIITHVLFGCDMLNELEKSSWKSAIENNKRLFLLGCQGPDIFFYNDFLPWVKNKRGPKIGDLMHLEKTGDFFIKGIKYIEENWKDKKDIELLFVYLAGFMCHFALDRNAHPFIFYFTGEYDKDRVETHKYKGFHKRLEQAIDVILLWEKRSMEAYKYPVFKKIDVGASLPKVVTDFYNYIFKELFNFEVNDDVANDSYKDTKKVFRVLFDPIGYKKILLAFVDLIFKDKVIYKDMVYPKNIDNTLDYMNKDHVKWVHPCNEDEEFCHSFYDLYDRGLEEGTDMVKAFISFLENRITEEDLKQAFPNLSYSTGKEMQKQYIQKYFSPIFKEKKGHH